MKIHPLQISESPLTLSEVHEVSVEGRHVALSTFSIQKIKEAHDFLQAQIKTGKVFYGVNTGFGLLSNVQIKLSEIESLQYNILRSHACGMGSPIEDRYVRAMLLLRAKSLSAGHSGVSVEIVNQILALLNHGICPLIPSQGSVGASGDLAPLAHLALVLIGEGRARVNGVEMDGAEALQNFGLTPVRLGAKEGLALINGTQFMSAIGTLNLLESEALCDLADLIGAMSLEALQGTAVAFDPEIHAVRPHPGQILVASRLRGFLAPDGKKSEIAKNHENCTKVQDPYSLRCMPQVHGASRDTLTYVRGVLEREINSVTDNPLVFPKFRRKIFYQNKLIHEDY